MARSSQFAVCGVKMALEDAGLNLGKINPEEGLISLGISTSAMDLIESQYQIFLKHGARRIVPYGIIAATPHRVMGELIDYFGWKTRTILLASACASSTDAIGVSLQKIRKGEAKIAIAGATDAAITPLIMAGLSSAGLTPEFNENPEKASRPFDHLRCGGILSEGCGIVIMEELEHAIARKARIYGEIIGYGTSGEISEENPSSGIRNAIKRAFQDAGVSYESVDGILAHAPSDPLIDKVETDIIKEIFCSIYIYLIREFFIHS